MPMQSTLVTASRSSQKNWKSFQSSTGQLQVARTCAAPVRAAAVSEPAGIAQLCSALEQWAEQCMDESALRVPVSQVELHVPQVKLHVPQGSRGRE